MQQLVDIFEHSKHLHHAYFVIGHKVEEVVSKLKHFLENTVGIKTSGNPDFTHRKFGTMTVEHASEIRDSESRRNIAGDKKVFIIEAETITLEAQNSLLKVFEEPNPGTHFFIVSPQDTLIPTLRGRMQVFFHVTEEDKNKSILKLDLKSRIAMVKDITDGIKDEEGTKQDAVDFLNQIERELYEGGVEKNAEKLKICQSTRDALYDRGAPVKIILENLVISV